MADHPDQLGKRFHEAGLRHCQAGHDSALAMGADLPIRDEDQPNNSIFVFGWQHSSGECVDNHRRFADRRALSRHPGLLRNAPGDPASARPAAYTNVYLGLKFHNRAGPTLLGRLQ